MTTHLSDVAKMEKLDNTEFWSRHKTTGSLIQVSDWCTNSFNLPLSSIMVDVPSTQA
jgi:hypothetical protein